MTERVILLDVNESHTRPDSRFANYEFMDMNADYIPEGDHQLIGTLNGVSVYLADTCVDFDQIPVDMEIAFSHGNIQLVDGEASGVSWQRSERHPLSEFQNFEALELADFVAEHHTETLEKNELGYKDCIVRSSVEEDTKPLLGQALELHLKT